LRSHSRGSRAQEKRITAEFNRAQLAGANGQQATTRAPVRTTAR
jgi:hypothetical protein